MLLLCWGTTSPCSCPLRALSLDGALLLAIPTVDLLPGPSSSLSGNCYYPWGLVGDICWIKSKMLCRVCSASLLKLALLTGGDVWCGLSCTSLTILVCFLLAIWIDSSSNACSSAWCNVSSLFCLSLSLKSSSVH